MNKYKARKIITAEGKFDSKKEYNRYIELLIYQKGGVITELKRQVPFVLIPSQRIEGKVVERECKYIADFTYYQDGKLIVEDTKGFRTKDYIIKRKLVLERYGIQIKEI